MTFIDPTVHINFPRHIGIGGKNFIAPYATLDAGPPGFIKIGNGSSIQDDAVIQGNPNRARGPIGVIIGDNSYVGPGATVRGPARVGALRSNLQAGVYANAQIDGAIVEPGAIVGQLARVGPGVDVPANIYVLPGANVTTQAEATNPALGKVRAVTAADRTILASYVTTNQALALGYATLYQGNAATGVSPYTTTAGVNNGNLAAITGASAEPGSATVSFEPATGLIPSFAGTPATFYGYRARLTGRVVLGDRPSVAASKFGRGDSIRADVGQPITIAGINSIGDSVSMHGRVGDKITIGTNFTAESNSRVLSNATLGNDVTLGNGSVVSASTLGNGVTVGARSLILNSTLAPGTNVPAGTILINNVVTRAIEW